jgi:hypothetical protein
LQVLKIQLIAKCGTLGMPTMLTIDQIGKNTNSSWNALSPPLQRRLTQEANQAAVGRTKSEYRPPQEAQIAKNRCEGRRTSPRGEALMSVPGASHAPAKKGMQAGKKQALTWFDGLESRRRRWGGSAIWARRRGRKKL